MRITYRTLGKLIDKMNEDQKDCDVTVEMQDETDGEVFPVELRICGVDHGVLDPEHPVLYVPINELEPRCDNVDQIWEEINGTQIKW